jgi:hypothetical protein
VFSKFVDLNVVTIDKFRVVDAFNLNKQPTMVIQENKCINELGTKNRGEE